jgi:putative ABC transport system ATP-binding protein
VRQRIVEARKRFAAELPAELHGAVAFFDPAQYNSAGSIEENIVFGKLAQGEADSRDKVHGLIGNALDELGLRELVIDIGLDFPVGTGGFRLSPAQRQKASLARALLKRPDLLVLNEATAALDGSSQTRVLRGLKQEFAAQTGGVFWSAHQVELARHFDKVLVIDGGRLVAQGTADDLTKPGGALAGLLPAERTGGGNIERTDGEPSDAGTASAIAGAIPEAQR